MSRRGWSFVPLRAANAPALVPSAVASRPGSVLEPTSKSVAQSLMWNASSTFGAYLSRRCSSAMLNPW